jgi:hypothetical protein
VGGPGDHDPSPWDQDPSPWDHGRSAWGEANNFYDIETERQINSGPEPVKRTRESARGQFPQLSPQSSSDISEYGSTGEEETNMEEALRDGIRHAYRDETWSQKSFTYDPQLQEFLGRRGTMQFFYNLPSILQLFELF